MNGSQEPEVGALGPATQSRYAEFPRAVRGRRILRLSATAGATERYGGGD